MSQDEKQYTELKKATLEELLAAALYGYSHSHAEFLRGVRFGVELAQDGGWQKVAPAWLEESKKGEGR